MKNRTFDGMFDSVLDSPDDSARRVLSSETTLAERTRSSALGKLAREIGLLFNMVKDYFRGSYRKVPTRVIVAAVAALAYVISPVDAVPDFIPVVGLLDDASVIAFVVSQIHHELNAYTVWRNDRR
jgi:uncharacterized membrane protein YkvA (DUF1232 family)